ncbi:unannotated protein [freshwater metagenome]|uniref:Unannotated protein n=1 Tax=freshwater metagenome TaxID=449393 RepID=A0A6J6DZE3_9ZZZZ
MAPLSRAEQIVDASVSVHPYDTEGTTTAGLKTAKDAATTSPGTCPMTEPRLVKYAGPSGAITPLNSPRLGAKPSFS